jgi:membrane protease YdiL (CAAX protease family)
MPRLTSVSPGRFFLLTFVLSWSIWIPLDLAHAGVEPMAGLEGASPLLRLFGVLMPATAAMILTVRAGGTAELRSLLGRLRIWRVGGRWWAAAVLVQPVLLVMAAAIANGIAGRAVVALEPLEIGVLLVSGLMLLLATLGEEIGWHGVGLPALQQRHPVLPSTLALGVLWATWHLPFWFLLDSFDEFGPAYLALNYLFILPLAIYTTWFFNGARFSLLLPVAFHVTFNVVNTALLPVTLDVTAFAVLIALEWALALIVLPALARPRPAWRPADLRATGTTSG